MTRPERGSRIAFSTGSPANARAVISKAPPGSPSSANRPLRVLMSNSVMASASGDGGEHVDAVVVGDRRVEADALAVEEDVDVAADHAALVEDPAARGRM